MNNNQKRLLFDLASQIKAEPKTRSQVVISLKSAKILTKKERLTSHYANLSKVVFSSK